MTTELVNSRYQKQSEVICINHWSLHNGTEKQNKTADISFFFSDQTWIQHIFTMLLWNLPVQDESMWYVDPLQVCGIVLWYAEKVQVVALLLIADLKQHMTQRG